MSIWEAFGMGRHKGFSREAGLLLDEAVELAGSMGCARADTGHLLLAMLQTDRGPAGRFLAGKNITEPAVRRQLAENRRGPAQHLDRHAMAPDLRRTMDYALIGAQNAHVSRAEPEHLLCAMLEDDGCTAGLLLLAAPQMLGMELAGLPTLAFVNGSIIRYDAERIANFNEAVALVNTDRIFPGVTIDGINVGGMTRADAESALGQGGVDNSSVNLHVVADAYTYDITGYDVPLYRNVSEMAAVAYAAGRGNTTALRGSGRTPLSERVATIRAMQQSPVTLQTQITYDRDAVRKIAENIAADVTCTPVNATVESFDPATKQFTFNSDISGAYLDANSVYQTLTGVLDMGNYTASLRLQSDTVLADVTKSQIVGKFGRISTYTTKTTSNSNRNTNIDLSCQAINGYKVAPGDTFSFNQATGQRTAAKGYKEATAISGGQSVPEVGGGVCQTSSTLFNAVARANLEIVYRSPHAWPSSYVQKGMDATVNWPNLDFKFKNDTEWPIYIVANYSKQKCTVEIYGMLLPDGVSIDLESTVTRTIDPPSDTKYVQNTKLAAGTQETTIKKRTGYVVETYQIWYQNGKEVDRKLLCTSTYKAYQETVEYN